MTSNKAAAAPASTAPSKRFGSLLDQLEKIWPFAKDGQPDEKEVDHVRYLTGKLQQLLSSQGDCFVIEKCRKELMSKSCPGIHRLLTILEVISNWDLQATLNIVACFNELLTSGKRIGALTDHELPDILLKALTKIASRESPKDPAVVEEIIILFHTVFSKMGTKDKRFAVQARMTGALQVSLNVAKQNPQNFKVLHPVLQVLKIYANSPVNCNIMVKGGAIEILLKILPFCGQKRVLSAKVILEILAFLVKSKIGARRAVIQGAVPLMMNMFVDWHRTDHRHRQVGVRKAILVVLKNIVVINSGRKALAHIDGMKILYNIGLEGIECKELDSMIKLIILILRRSFARPSLPIRTSNSVFSFRVKSPVDTESSTDNSEDEFNIEACHDDVSVANQTDDYHIDIDDNDDVNEDDDEHMPYDDRYSGNDNTETVNQPKPKMRNDLEMYNVYVNELLEYTVDSNTQSQIVDVDVDKGNSIVIPTATMDGSFKHSTDDFASCNYGFKHDYQRFRKSASLDSNYILTERRCITPNTIFKSDSTNEVEYVTESTISHIGNLACQPSNISLPRCKTPSMPLISSHHTANSTSLDGMDLLVKGMRLRSDCNSSPSLRDLMNSRYSLNGSQAEHDNDEKVPRCGKPRSLSNALSALDLERRRANDDDDIEMKHILPFVKDAAPGIYGHYPVIEPEPLLDKKPGVHRLMIFQDFYRFICPDKIINRVVYDLDELISGQSTGFSHLDITSNYVLSPKRTNLPNSKPSNSFLNTNGDFSKLPSLHFESRFESGNLRKAIQIRQYEYDLILNCDINSDHHCQWFYFEVSNMEQDVAYRFNIINCEKFNSQFNYGMQPVLYSTKDAEDGQPGWERTGSSICYYKNFYQRSADGLRSNKYYFTATFTIRFLYSNDVCYLAYHYPYTVSMMKAHLCKLEARLTSNIYYDNQILCFTSHGNECDIITITERPNKDDQQSVIAFRKRPYVVLTSRVHPGESCSSWVIKGALDFLISNNELAIRLRETYVFKIIPCLNPDGVINGNHRCSISGDDLNRQWVSPDPNNHPTIYHTKGFIQYLNSINKPPLAYCDFHGHSRKKNVFMYGCSVAATNAARQQGNMDTVFFNLVNGAEGESRIEMTAGDDLAGSSDEDTGYKTLPRILNALAPAFSIQSCNYVMEKSKEATARIVVFKELGILRSYTLESTYCGADQGPYKGNHFGTRELEEMGKNFCVGLLKLSQSYSVRVKREHFSEPSFYTCERDDETGDITDERPKSFADSEVHSY